MKKKIMKKKMLLLSLMLLLVISSVVIGYPPPMVEPVVIEVWHHSAKPEEVAVWEAQRVAFNEMQDEVYVVITILPEIGYTLAVIAAAIANMLPDLIFLDGPTIAFFAWHGHVMSIEEFVTDELLADFLPSILDQGTFRGTLYSLATFDSGLAIWGNRRLLEKAGVRIPQYLEDRWTWEEFNEVLSKLYALPELEYAIDFKMNYGMGEWITYGFAPIVQGFGGDLICRIDYLSADQVLNSPEAIAAMEWMQNLFKKGYTIIQTDDDDFWGDQKVALSWVGHWMWPVHSAALGDDLVLIPMPEFPVRPATGMGSWTWAIPAGTDHAEEAWKFKYFLLQPEEILRITDANGAVPSRLTALEKSELYMRGGPLEIFKQQLMAGVGVVRPVTPAYPIITIAFAAAVWDILTAHADVQTMLDRAVNTIDAHIEAHAGFPKR